MSKADEIIDEVIERTPVTLPQLLKSVWGIIAAVFGLVGVVITIISFIGNTFPTNSDLVDKYIAKAEYYTKSRENKDIIEKQIKETNDNLEKQKKIYEGEIRKIRLEYRVERMHDLGQQLKLVDEKIKDHPEDTTLKNYRESIWKEYNRVRNKIDEGVKDLE